MNHLKTLSCNSENPERIDEEFKNWRESMRKNNKKLVEIISTTMTCNQNRLFVSVIYKYSHIFEKELLLERMDKLKLKKKLVDKGLEIENNRRRLSMTLNQLNMLRNMR